MAHIVANLPAIKCFVRKEFLYDFQKGHGELEPCWWVSIKSLRGQAFRIESYLNNYGALYDKLPLHAYCWKPIEGEPLPLDYLQLWDRQKKNERFLKINLKKQNEDLVSCIEPLAFSERFHQFMSEHVFREHLKIS